MILQRTYNDIFVGRVKELGMIDNFFVSLQENSFLGNIYIEGESGIGKSRLVHEYLKNSKIVNKFTLVCKENEDSMLFPVISFFKNHFEIDPNGAKRSNLKKFNSKFEQLVPDYPNYFSKKEIENSKKICKKVLGLSTNKSKFSKDEIKKSLKIILLIQTQGKPTILTIEDAHWMDNETWSFCESIFLDNKILKYNLGFIFTARATDKKIKNNLFNFKRDNAGLNSEFLFMNINKFDIDDSGSFLQEKLFEIFYTDNDSYDRKQILTSEKSSGLFDLIKKKSDKNPFYMEEILKYLKNKKINLSTVTTDDQFQNYRNIISKKTREDIIAERLKQISKKQQGIIGLAASFKDDVDIKIMNEILKDKQSIANDYIILEKSELLTTINEQNIIFKHAILKKIAYQKLSTKIKRKQHKLIAEAIEKIYQNNIEEYFYDLAFHYGKTADIDKYLYYLEEAAFWGIDCFDYKKAVGYFELLDKKLETQFIIDKLISCEKQNEVPKNINKLAYYRVQMLGLYDILGEYAKFEKIRKELILLVDNKIISHQRVIYNILYKYAEHLFYQNKNDKAILFLKSRLDINIITDLQWVNRLYGLLAYILTENGQLEDAYKILLKQIEINSKLEDNFKDMDVYNSLAIYFNIKGNSEKALVYINSFIDFYLKIKDYHYLFYGYSNKGNAYLGQNKIDEALKIYKLAFDCTLKEKNMRSQATAFENLGRVYFEKGNFIASKRYYMKAIILSKEYNYSQTITSVSINIAILFQTQGLFVKALEYYNIALKLFENLKDTQISSSINANIGELYLLKKDYQKAYSYLNKAIKIDKKLGLGCLNYHLYIMAKILFMQKKYQESSAYLEKVDNKSSDSKLLFLKKILLIITKFYNSASLSEKIYLWNQIFNFNQELFKDNKDREAKISYNLWKMSTTIYTQFDEIEIEKYSREILRIKTLKNNAIHLYTSLYKNCKKYKYKIILRELGEKKYEKVKLHK